MRLLITALLLAMNAVLATNLVQKWLDGEDFQFPERHTGLNRDQYCPAKIRWFLLR
ncbi:MAG: hypothetical protein IPL70_12965 [Uliginosibacterium sp.]|nr:hypothetical protein [Uliginosibacterium sp.]